MPWIPKDAVLSLAANKRIAIIGPPGSGKSTSLLTFPNLIVFDRDKNCPPGVTAIPAWDPAWADSLSKRTFGNIPNFRDASLKWLKDNHDKFEEDQTFALDSWTFLQDACDLQNYAEDEASADKNGFAFWKSKLEFSKKVAEYLKAMKCWVVVIMHETIDRDEKGRVNGKIRPVQDGSYKDQVLGVFNNVWRMRGNMPKEKPVGGLAPMKPDGTKKEVERIFYWQLFGDSVVDLKLDAVLGNYCRRHGIRQIEVSLDENGHVTGGFQKVQEIYELAKANFVKQTKT